MAHLADRRAFLHHLSPAGRSAGWSSQRRPSPGLKRCSPICRATPTGGDREPPADRLRSERRHLPLQGLPSQRRGPADAEEIAAVLDGIAGVEAHILSHDGKWTSA